MRARWPARRSKTPGLTEIKAVSCSFFLICVLANVRTARSEGRGRWTAGGRSPSGACPIAGHVTGHGRTAQDFRTAERLNRGGFNRYGVRDEANAATTGG